MQMLIKQAVEDYLSPPKTVDPEKGTIFGVRILGKQSKNKREYSDSCIEASYKKYEGLAVHTNHGVRGQNRRFDERCGWLESVERDSDGAVGNLALLKSHPHTPMILEAAQRRPQLFGLSHCSDLVGQYRQDGIFVVESMPVIHCVDIVTNPATTRGFFEMNGDDPRAMLAHAAAMLLTSGNPDDMKLADGVMKLLKKSSAPPEGEPAPEGEAPPITEETANRLLQSFKIKPNAGLVKSLTKCDTVEEALEIVESLAPRGAQSTPAGGFSKLPQTKEEMGRYLNS